ncbi:hypothetical protein [Streptomyces pseudogriseolus]|uniref:hypothetical protein n=1 Tax=Streptomyces pseudogriseolus TaxID=36817 RepID=UPI003476404D
MTMNAEMPHGQGAAFQEDQAADGSRSAATVPQQPSQGDALFPVTPAPLSARPLVLVTRGRVEYLAHCPNCRDWHRHVHLGNVTGPCGTEYELQSRRGRAA